MMHGLFVLLVALATGSFSDDVFVPSSPAKVTSIKVGGQGFVERKPNLATVVLSLETQGSSTSAARDAHIKRCSPVRAALTGFFSKHANTKSKVLHESLDIQPVYRYAPGGGESSVVGYKASSQFTVRVEELDDLGSLIDAVTSAEAALNGVTMGLKEADLAAAQTEARDRAVKDALAIARAMAASADLTVTRIDSISQSSDFSSGASSMAYRAMSPMAADSGSAAPDSGILKFTARVDMQVSAVPLK